MLLYPTKSPRRGKWCYCTLQNRHGEENGATVPYKIAIRGKNGVTVPYKTAIRGKNGAIVPYKTPVEAKLVLLYPTVTPSGTKMMLLSDSKPSRRQK